MLGVKEGLATATDLPIAGNCEWPPMSQNSWGRNGGTGAVPPSSSRSSAAGGAATRPLRSEGSEGNKGGWFWAAGVNKAVFGVKK